VQEKEREQAESALVQLHDEVYEEMVQEWQKQRQDVWDRAAKLRSLVIDLKNRGWRICVVHPGSRSRLALDLKVCHITNLTSVVVSGTIASPLAFSPTSR